MWEIIFIANYLKKIELINFFLFYFKILKIKSQIKILLGQKYNILFMEK